MAAEIVRASITKAINEYVFCRYALSLSQDIKAISIVLSSREKDIPAHDVCFYPFEKDWKKRIDCRTCNQRYYVTGLPCEHAALSLYLFHTCKRSDEEQQVIQDNFTSDGRNLLVYNDKVFYHEVHHLTTFVDQYAGSIATRTPIIGNIKQFDDNVDSTTKVLFPHNFSSNLNSRKRKKRYQKGEGSKTAAATTTVETSESSSEESTLDDDGMVADLPFDPHTGMEYFQGLSDVPAVKHNRCTKCGSYSHYAPKCKTKNAPYMIGTSRVFNSAFLRIIYRPLFGPKLLNRSSILTRLNVVANAYEAGTIKKNYDQLYDKEGKYIGDDK
jgi:hypothetical protein